MVVGALRSFADIPGSTIALAPVAAASDGGSGGGGRQSSSRREVASPATVAPPAIVSAAPAPVAASATASRSAAPPPPQPLQPPGGGADPTAFRATEVVALAQLVLTRNFHGPVRTATAQELLFQARMALAKGESSLASDLANLASRMMAPQGFDGTGRNLGLRPEELAAQAMQSGGGPALDDGGPAAPALAAPTAPAAMIPLQGLAPLTLRERGVVLQAPPAKARVLASRLATDGTPRGIPRT